MSKPIVLITGISGFVGSHVAVELVKNGYAVRGTVRAAKQESLNSSLSNQADISLIPLEDVATGDLTEALKGVHAVIHIASPLAGKETPEKALKIAIEGTTNVLRQAAAAGVNKVVLTSSWGTTLHPSLKETFAGITFNENSWGEVTDKDALEGPNPLYVYLSTKILAERAAWAFAKENPGFDLATINPPFIYGPKAEGFPHPSPGALGTNGLVYALIKGEPGRPLPLQLPPFFSDVRDVAKAHVAALKVENSALGKNKRYLISGGLFTWRQATEYIATEFPELKSRLPALGEPGALPGKLSAIDTKPASEELGLNAPIDWKTTVRDTIKTLLEAEESWKSG